MVMSPVLMRIDDESAFSAYTPVGTPTSTTVAQVRTAETVQIPEGSSGIWECTPGCFRRGVVQAEFSYSSKGLAAFAAMTARRWSFAQAIPSILPLTRKASGTSGRLCAKPMLFSARRVFGFERRETITGFKIVSEIQFGETVSQ
jgi:hypothetical protein